MQFLTNSSQISHPSITHNSLSNLCLSPFLIQLRPLAIKGQEKFLPIYVLSHLPFWSSCETTKLFQQTQQWQFWFELVDVLSVWWLVWHRVKCTSSSYLLYQMALYVACQCISRVVWIMWWACLITVRRNSAVRQYFTGYECLLTCWRSRD